MFTREAGHWSLVTGYKVRRMRKVFCFESVLRSGAAAILTRVHGTAATVRHCMAWQNLRHRARGSSAGITKNHMW
jgi:hypothetical protein